jgi:hypothetical protein
MSHSPTEHFIITLNANPGLSAEVRQRLWDYLDGRNYIFSSPAVCSAYWTALDWAQYVRFVGDPHPMPERT